MNELIFVVEEAPEGGYTAHALGEAIFTEADDVAGLHAKMQFEFVEPVRVGMRVRSYGKVIDKYEKRGRHYMVTEFAIKNEDSGAVLARGQFTQMIFPVESEE